MRRRRSTPWIHRWSRPMMAAIAGLGALETAFMTIAELTGNAETICPTTGCKQVLTSPYASAFGVPLTVLGFLGYTTMLILAIAPRFINPETQKDLHHTVEKWTGLLLFAGGTAMLVGSAYLMGIMTFKIQAFCPYCVASALLSTSLFVLVLVGQAWQDLGQVMLIGLVVGMVTIVGTIAAYNNVNNPTLTQEAGAPPVVTSVSGPAEVALARHLTAIGAQEFGAYWCPHCHDQKELFGAEAAQILNYVECDPSGKNSQTALCQQTGITGFPTWKIKGQLYPGVRNLNELATLSGYTGSRNFQR